MMPTVEDVCIKDIVSISINKTLEEAIKKMASSNIRNILVVTNSDEEDIYYMLTTNDIIEFKIESISLNTPLRELNLRKIRKIDGKISILEVLNEATIDNDYMAVMLNKKLVGIISQTDIVNNIDPKMLMERQTIGNFILQYIAVTVYEDEATLNAVKMMKEKNIDALIIINQDQKAIGIFTTKDFLNLIHLDSDLSKSIKNYMTSPLQTISSETTIYDALEYIRKKRFKRLIVDDENGNILGVITQVELLRLINNKWVEIVQKKGNELSKINEELLKKSEQLEAKASTDFLTKLYNRSKFDAVMQYEIKQIRRYTNRNLSMIIIDIDDFKYINDTYGHDLGDKILQTLAHILKICSRSSDIPARWGGEEFVVSLPETNIEQAMLVGEKIRSTVLNHEFEKNIKVTCSIGVSQFHSDDEYESMFKRADNALYKAKQSGKNKVVLEELQ